MDNFSPRTVRRQKRKQLVAERKADMPPIFLVEDGDYLTRRSDQNFPDDCYYEAFHRTSPTAFVPPEQLQELEHNYETTNIVHNLNGATEMLEQIVGENGALNTTQAFTTPITSGAGGANLMKNPVSIKIAALASRHRLTNTAVNDILDFAKEVSLLHRYSIPRNVKSVEHDLWNDEVKSKFVWKCPGCNNFRSCNLLAKPFQQKCCATQIASNADHYIIFDSHDLLRIQIPLVFTHIQLDKYLKYRPKLLKQREKMRFSNYDISITVNLDGVSLAKGSRCVIWPLLGYFDGTSSRCADQNILLFGFWLGQSGSKPDFEVLLTPFIDAFKLLQNDGVSWKMPDGTMYNSKVIISCCLCDSVAKPLVQGMMQWNSEYGCPYCLHCEPGDYFTPLGKPGELRTNAQYRAIYYQLQRKNTVQSHGIRMPSPFVDLPYFDIILDFPPCIMHAGYLGVCKTLTEIFIRSHQNDPFYISAQNISTINSYLKTIQPPYRVSRTPRSLKFFPWYKAHELCMWLFYYSAPVLQELLPDLYFHHWLLLIRGLSSVMRMDFTLSDLEDAATNLNNFCRETFDLYGKTACHFNFHLMKHMPLLAKNIGPICQYSMAPFETYNMQIKSYLTSSQHMGEQIAKRYLRDLNVKAFNSASSSIPPSKETWRARRIGQEDWFRCSTDQCSVSYYGKILLNNGRKLYSRSYIKSQIRNSCCFLISDRQFFEVNYFVKVPCGNNKIAVGTMYFTETVFDLHYFFKAIREECTNIDISELGEIVMKIHRHGVVYFTRFLNDIECYSE